MYLIGQLIEITKNQQGRKIVLINDQDPIIYRSDGSSLPVSKCLELEQMRKLLEEILPEHYRNPFESGMPVQFKYAHPDGFVNIDAFQSEDGIRLSLELEEAISSSPDAQSDAMTPHLTDSVSIVTESTTETVSLTPPSTIGERPPSLQSNQNFLKQIPWSLSWPLSRLRALGAIVGVVLGMGISFTIYLLASKKSMLGQVFDLREFATMIPVSVLCMFFWGATLCFLRWLRLRHLERISSKTLLDDATRILSLSGLAALFKELEGPIIQISPLLRRLYVVTQQWLIRPNLQDTSLLMEQQIYNDEEEVRSGFNLIRTFVWALPVLGLIGTVIGISLAVGGFSQFLSGNVEDVAVIKKSLVGVTGGLSFSFLITLEGLLTSLLLMLASSGLQTREEKLYSALQQDIADIFLPVLQKVAPEESTSVSDPEGLALLREVLRGVAESVLKTVSDASTRLIKVMDERESAHYKQSEQWATILNGVMETMTVRMGEVSNKIATSLADIGNVLIDRVACMQNAFDQQNIKLRQVFNEHELITSQQCKEIITGFSEQNQAVRDNAKFIADLTATTQQAINGTATLQMSVHKLNKSNPQQVFSTYIEALLAQSREIQQTRETVAEFKTTAQSVLEAQVTLQKAIQQLHETGFNKTFVALNESLLALGPVLSSFRAPFVLQAVPVGIEAFEKK